MEEKGHDLPKIDAIIAIRDAEVGIYFEEDEVEEVGGMASLLTVQWRVAEVVEK